MTRRKIETPHAKTCSAYEKQLKRKKRITDRLWTSNEDKKELIRKYESLTKDLMKKGFVSKEYISKFITKRGVPHDKDEKIKVPKKVKFKHKDGRIITLEARGYEKAKSGLKKLKKVRSSL